MPPYRSRTIHPRPQHGGRARPLARDRHEGRRFRQADHRHRQFLHPVRARPRASEGPRPARRARGRGGGRRRQGVQHHRRRRRHRDGPRRHALFAAVARDHRRQRRIHGQRPLRRRAGLHLELRQDHARHADGGDAPQHPRRVRLRRPDGGRQGQALDRARAASTSSTRWSPPPIPRSPTPTSR